MVNKNDSEESVPLEASFKENSQKLDIQQSAEEGANGTDSGGEGGDPVPPEPNTPEEFFVAAGELVESYVNINMNFLRVSHVGAPTELEHKEKSNVVDEGTQTYSSDAVRLADTKNLLLRPEYASNIQCLMLKGGTMQGDINMGDNGITGIDDYYYSGEPTAIASGAALETAVLDYAGSWLSAKQELQNLNSGGLDELEKDLGVQSGTTDINADTCKLLLRDGKSTMAGDLVFVDQDLVGGPIDDVPEEGNIGDVEEGNRSENEGEEETPTEPIRNPTITNIKDPEGSSDIVTRKYVDLVVGKLPLGGGTVLGDIDANHYSIFRLKELNAVIVPDSLNDRVSEAFGLFKEFNSEFGISIFNSELDDSILITASDVLKSFKNKYMMEYLCRFVESRSTSIPENNVWEAVPKEIESSGASDYWSSSFEGGLKIKKSGVYLLSFNLSVSLASIPSTTSSVVTLKMKKINNLLSEDNTEILAKFSLNASGSASAAILVYAEPDYFNMPDKNSSEVSVFIELDNNLSDMNISWQISLIEDVSVNREEIKEMTKAA
ncbi:hypothetical protein [Chlamydiifrater volucris]|uniref:hypothetical protein n=1 Tax=Chlamydiifrater volucris TaxID=2681470 RepID=UPI001BD02061|nr:hypothetical protein [Chlamydiifrater volucris]